MEPYEFKEYVAFLEKDVLVYRCFRGRCDGRTVWVADRKTHNHYHNEIEAGRPSPYR